MFHVPLATANAELVQFPLSWVGPNSTVTGPVAPLVVDVAAEVPPFDTVVDVSGTDVEELADREPPLGPDAGGSV